MSYHEDEESDGEDRRRFGLGIGGAWEQRARALAQSPRRNHWPPRHGFITGLATMAIKIQFKGVGRLFEVLAVEHGNPEASMAMNEGFDLWFRIRVCLCLLGFGSFFLCVECRFRFFTFTTTGIPYDDGLVKYKYVMLQKSYGYKCRSYIFVL